MDIAITILRIWIILNIIKLSVLAFCSFYTNISPGYILEWCFFWTLTINSVISLHICRNPRVPNPYIQIIYFETVINSFRRLLYPGQSILNCNHIIYIILQIYYIYIYYHYILHNCKHITTLLHNYITT